MRTLVAALALAALALSLRLPHGDLAEWKGDEAITFHHERALAREGVFPARGLPTTDGPRIPVHFLYVLSVPVIFADSPEAVRVGIALLSSAVVVLAFVAGRRDLGARTALAWALLLAVLPDLVRRGRWCWSPNLIPPLATLALLLLVRARRRPEGLAGAGLLAFGALLPLIHYSLVGLGAVVFVFGLAWTRRRGARLAGGVAALLLLAPHVVIESKTGFQATRGAFAVAGHEGRQPARAPLAYPALAVRALELESYARAASAPGRPLEPLAFAAPVTWLLRGLLALGLGLAVASLARGRARALEPPALALLAALGGWAPFLVLGLPARAHYVPGVVPALALLVAYALTRARVLGLLLAPIGWASVLSVWAVLAGVERGLVGTGSEYDLPYREKMRACRELLADELELVRAPQRFEYLILLEVAHRELPEVERARFTLEPKDDAKYWDLVYQLPHPKRPRGRAEIVLANAEALVVKIP